MNGRGIPLEAHLVVDNSFLVMLTEFFCECRTRSLPPAKVIPTLGEHICSQIDTLKHYAADGLVHSTKRVTAEYQPWNGPRLSSMRHIPFSVKQQLAREVTKELHKKEIDLTDILVLRHQPDAPRRFVGASGLSDEDFSLVAVAIELSQQDAMVYLLSNDQDLLGFVTWIRRKPEARELWPTIGGLQGLHSLTYLELVHRNCRINTATIRELFNFVLREHYRRKELAGTTKGESIMDQLLEIQSNLIQSVAIKISNGRTVS